MLDRLVESKNHNAENKKLNSLLGTIFMVTAVALTFAFTYSLFSFELNVSSDLELSSLVAPTFIDEVEPQPQIVQKQQSTEKVTNDVATRRDNIQQLTESPAKSPDTISVAPSNIQARPSVPFKIGKMDYTPTSATSNTTIERESNVSAPVGISKIVPTVLDNDNDKDLPVIKKTEKEPVKLIEKKIDTIVSGGVVNGKAKFLAQPIYSAAAKQVRASGRVEVQVTIDENGRVVSASIVSGHTLLRESALNAARKSTFSPTLLTNQPVKVSGIIIYNFNP